MAKRISEIATSTTIKGWHLNDSEIGNWGWYCRWKGTFDNMNNRPILADTDWQQYALVVDVPEESTSMSFGLFLIGAGKMWLDEVKFEVVDKTVPLNGLLPAPTNLNFEDQL
jgi:hypothetical protein